MNYNITGYSTALFSTWYFIEELGVLFDCGDGLIASLLQKSRKIENVFVSHADRDHLTGLLQFNQLNARDGFPIIHFPKNCSSFPFMEEFFKKFDPHSSGTQWRPIEQNDEIRIKDDMTVLAIRNNHVKADANISKSLSFKIIQSKKKLKPEYAGLSQKEIVELIKVHGREYLSEEVRTNIISYSGDTPVEDYERWNNSKILIHEATFLGLENESIDHNRNKHSTLEEVMKMVSEINIEKLILGHFSSRYHADEIDSAIRKCCEKYQIKIPVHRVLPGQVHRNILEEKAVN